MVAVCMKEMEDGAGGKIQGSIHPASNSGMRDDMGPMVLGPGMGHQ